MSGMQVVGERQTRAPTFLCFVVHNGLLRSPRMCKHRMFFRGHTTAQVMLQALIIGFRVQSWVARCMRRRCGPSAYSSANGPPPKVPPHQNSTSMHV